MIYLRRGLDRRIVLSQMTSVSTLPKGVGDLSFLRVAIASTGGSQRWLLLTTASAGYWNDLGSRFQVPGHQPDVGCTWGPSP